MGPRGSQNIFKKSPCSWPKLDDDYSLIQTVSVTITATLGCILY